jgi:2-oxoglutarate dehydrogenase E2 component (dihydrolipoamide succinyltransferase)
MKHELKAPQVGESITEVVIGRWIKQAGEAVKAGEAVLEIESEKASLEVAAEHDGVLSIARQPGETVGIGEVVGYVDDAGTPTATPQAKPAADKAPAPTAAPAAAQAAPGTLSGPAARKMAEEQGIDITTVPGTGRGGRVTKGDLLEVADRAPSQPAPSQPESRPAASVPAATPTEAADPRTRREPMSLMRRKIAERLVAAQHTAAILTTFNEVDLAAVNKLRAEHKESFKAKHGVGLGYMSLFTRAACLALQEHPKVNAFIEGNEIVYHDYQDVGIAVGTPRGLVVPVIRDAGAMNVAQIEQEIARLAARGRDGKLSVADMSGGTFTISNGGTYGSMLSTPILTPPQSAILGMHNILQRPVVVDGQIVIRPMMYLAVSYDHRLLDGKDAVLFLVSIKKFLEAPDTMGLQL